MLLQAFSHVAGNPGRSSWQAGERSSQVEEGGGRRPLTLKWGDIGGSGSDPWRDNPQRLTNAEPPTTIARLSVRLPVRVTDRRGKKGDVVETVTGVLGIKVCLPVWEPAVVVVVVVGGGLTE